METLIKIVAIGLVTCFAMLLIKPVKADFALMVGIVGGIIILSLIVNFLSSVLSTINSIILKTGLSQNVFSLVLKVVGIGYLTEFAASLCYDCGSGSLADKMLFAGKIVLLVISMPIVMDILNIIMELAP